MAKTNLNWCWCDDSTLLKAKPENGESIAADINCENGAYVYNGTDDIGECNCNSNFTYDYRDYLCKNPYTTTVPGVFDNPWGDVDAQDTTGITLSETLKKYVADALEQDGRPVDWRYKIKHR